MDESTLRRFLARKFIQTSIVIALTFISLWYKHLDPVATVSLVIGALGIYAKADYEEKKLGGTE